MSDGPYTGLPPRGRKPHLMISGSRHLADERFRDAGRNPHSRSKLLRSVLSGSLFGRPSTYINQQHCGCSPAGINATVNQRCTSAINKRLVKLISEGIHGGNYYGITGDLRLPASWILTYKRAIKKIAKYCILDHVGEFSQDNVKDPEHVGGNGDVCQIQHSCQKRSG